MTSRIITRFAPSPTGDLHLGGARIAILNYMFAKKYDGIFLVRFEDTDKERSDQNYISSIIENLNCLEIYPDKYYFQSENVKRHQNIVNKLIEKGKAYRCYLTNDELKLLQDEANKTGKKIISPYRDNCQIKNLPFVVRLKVSHKGKTEINDMISGNISVQNDQIDDFVLLRSDGSPTYMLSSVVDDYDMKITHIIRGNDHITNAIRQIKIIEAMEWQPPKYAHVPLIYSENGEKLAKRNGDKSILDYTHMGYTSNAIFNYIVRLGYGHTKDDIELNKKEIIKNFDINSIGKSPTRINEKHIEDLTKKHMEKQDFKNFIIRLHINLLESNNISSHIISRMKKLYPFLWDSARNLKDFVDYEYALTDSPPVIKKELLDLIDKKAKENLRYFKNDMPKNFNSIDLEKWTDDWLKENNMKKQDFLPILRIALTGKTKTASIIKICECLGYDQVKSRIENIF